MHIQNTYIHMICVYIHIYIYLYMVFLSKAGSVSPSKFAELISQLEEMKNQLGVLVKDPHAALNKGSIAGVQEGINSGGNTREISLYLSLSIYIFIYIYAYTNIYTILHLTSLGHIYQYKLI